MATASATARARYATDAQETASPARLLTMLYDRLVLDLLRAEQAIADGDAAAAGEHLGHAQAIVFELLAALDTSAWAGARKLASLYAFFIRELTTARSNHDPRAVAACRGLVEPLRDAWHEAARASLGAS